MHPAGGSCGERGEGKGGGRLHPKGGSLYSLSLSLSLHTHTHACMHTYIHSHTPELIAHVLAATVRHSAGQTSLVGELASLRESGHKEV
jgi:hypothetical protein